MFNVNKEILKGISNLRRELRVLKKVGTREQQLDCFKRLTNLYSQLNVEYLTDIVNDLTDKSEQESA